MISLNTESLICSMFLTGSYKFCQCGEVCTRWELLFVWRLRWKSKFLYFKIKKLIIKIINLLVVSHTFQFGSLRPWACKVLYGVLGGHDYPIHVQYVVRTKIFQSEQMLCRI